MIASGLEEQHQRRPSGLKWQPSQQEDLTGHLIFSEPTGNGPAGFERTGQSGRRRAGATYLLSEHLAHPPSYPLDMFRWPFGHCKDATQLGSFLLCSELVHRVG